MATLGRRGPELVAADRVLMLALLPQIHVLDPNVRWDGIRRRGLWEVIRP